MRDFLRRQIESACREELGATSIHRLCPRCAGADHGRPSVRVEVGPAPYVSWSYAADLAVLAWTWAGPIGVDVERVGDPAEDRSGWTRAEALLKATGEGVTSPPAQDGTPRIPAHWTVPLDDVPEGYVAHAVVLGVPEGPPPERPALNWVLVPQSRGTQATPPA